MVYTNVSYRDEGRPGYYHLPPLVVAIKTRDKTMVCLLLEKGANIDALVESEGSPLIAAIETRDASMVELLLEKGANVNLSAPCLYRLPLVEAIVAADEKITTMLIGYGADVNSRFNDSSNVTYNALQYALYKRHFDMAQVLIEHEADVNQVGGPYHTPLQAAAANGNIEMVQILLQRGADIHLLGGEYGNALQAALDEQHHEIAKILIEHGAQRARPPSSSGSDEESAAET